MADQPKLTAEEMAGRIVKSIWTGGSKTQGKLGAKPLIASAIRETEGRVLDEAVERVNNLFRGHANQDASNFGLVQMIWADVIQAIREGKT